MALTTSTDPLDVPENRELLIALLDSAAKRYRKWAQRDDSAQPGSSAAWRDEAETCESLSAYFEAWPNA